MCGIPVSQVRFPRSVIGNFQIRKIYAEVELGDILQKNRKEGIFVIPVSISSKKFYTGKPKYCKNTSIL